MRPDPIGLAGGVNFYSYVQNNPIRFVDSLGLKCSLIGTTSYSLLTDTKEKIVAGDWLFQRFLQVNIGCVCIYYRELRIDVTETYTIFNTYIFECIEEECGEYYSYLKYQTYTDTSTENYSKYGGREYESRVGAMVGTNSVRRGSSCNCVKPNPPGLYSR